MDEAYDSPDSDGHASIPSPTETSFNQSFLPQSGINWHDSYDFESSSDEDDDEPIRISRNLPSKPAGQRTSRFPDSPTTVRVLQPTTPNSDSPRGASRRPSQEKRSSENNVPSDSDGALNDSDINLYAVRGVGTSDDKLRPSRESSRSRLTNNHRKILHSLLQTKKLVCLRGSACGRNETSLRESLPWPQDIDLRYPGMSADLPLDHKIDGPENLSPGKTSLPFPEIDTLNNPVSERPRNVSGMTIRSVDLQNETFEEIDASSIIDTIAHQPFSDSAPCNGAQKPSAESLSIPDSQDENHRILSPNLLPPTTPQNKPMRTRLLYNLHKDTFTPKDPPPTGPPSSLCPNGLPLHQSRMSDSNLSVALGTNHHQGSLLNQDMGSLHTPPNLTERMQQNCSQLVNENSNVDVDSRQDSSANHGDSGENSESSTPRFPYQNFSLWKLKHSKTARRMSMNTPPSNSSLSTTVSEFLRKEPPSPLGSDFQFPLANSEQQLGLKAPPNSTTNTPISGDAARLSIERAQSVLRRDRSQSDPLDTKVGSDGINLEQKPLFSPRRVCKGAFEPQENASNAELDHFSVTSTSSIPESHVVSSEHEEPHSGSKIETEQSDRAVSNSIQGRNSTSHVWPEISQNSVSQDYNSLDNAMLEQDSDTFQGQDISPGSLKLDEVEVRVQTPLSVNDDRKDNNQMQELESLLSATRLSDEHHKPDSDNLPNLIGFYEKYEQEDGQTKKNHSLKTSGQEEKPFDFEALIDHNKKPEENSEGSLSNPDLSLFTPTAIQLNDKIEIMERELKLKDQRHRREKEEDEQTIRHLRAALDQTSKSTLNNETLNIRVRELERELHQIRQAHNEDVELREAKFTQILTERDAEVNHLQAELDELANLMPVDHSVRLSNRLLQEDDGDSWLEEKSREISQFFDESIDHIIAEIHGETENDNYDQYVEEAEMSLRQMATRAGFGPDLNKASLAAFGIRQLREENNMLREDLCEKEQQIEILTEINNTLTQEISEARTEVGDVKVEVADLVSRNSVLQTMITSHQLSIEQLRNSLDETQTQLAKVEKEHGNTITEKNNLDDLVKSVKSEKNVIETLYFTLQTQSEDHKNQAVYLEETMKQREDQLSVLQNDLNTFKEDSTALQAEIEAYKYRNTELIQTIEMADTNRKEETATLKQQIADLMAENESQSKRLDSVTQSVIGKNQQYDEAMAKIHVLEEKLAISNKAISKLNSEKQLMEQSINKTETEIKQARSRYNVLMHEIAEKESIWNNIKGDLQAEIDHKIAELRHVSTPYKLALERIANELDEISPSENSDYEVLEHFWGELANEGIADPVLVASILWKIKAMDEFLDAIDQRRKDLEQKNERLKTAIKKWGSENIKEKSKVEGLLKENKDLATKLRAEKKQNDDKIGQLILALRR